MGGNKVKVSRAVAKSWLQSLQKKDILYTVNVCLHLVSKVVILPSHCAALEQVMSIGEGVDFLLALDQETVDMHGVEVRDGGYIICDSKVKPDFSKFEGSKVNCLSLPISETAMKQGSLLMRNIVALGMSVALLGFDTKMFKDAIAAKICKKSQEIMDKNLAAFDDGHGLVMEKLGDVEIDTLTSSW